MQSAVQHVRSLSKNRGICYLCGWGLHRHGCVSDEHVVPRQLLREFECPEGPHRWPISLPVHKRCDDNTKRHGDELAIQYTRMITNPESDRILNRFEEKALQDLIGIPFEKWREDNLPILHGAAPVMASATHWVRGCLMALYGRFVPYNTKQILISPPSFQPRDDVDANEAIAEDQEFFLTCYRSTLAAWQTGVWDGIVAWGGGVSFLCSWTLAKHGRRRKHRATACWWLDVPGAIEISADTAPTPRAWHGLYFADTLPPETTPLDDALLSAHDERWQKDDRQLPRGHLIHRIVSVNN